MVTKAPTALILTGLPGPVDQSATAADLALVQAIRRDVNLRIDPGHLTQPTATPTKMTPRCLPPESALHLGRLFEAVAESRGHAPALTNRTVVWSYHSLLRAARSVAGELLSQPGFRSGDPVVVLLGNSPEYIAAFYGVLLAGGVVVPLAPRTETGLLGAILASTEAVALITDSATWKLRTDLAGSPSQKCDLATSRGEAVSAAGVASQLTGHELAAIFFTGGSTGTPKGVMLSHRNLMANARSIQQYLQIDSHDRPLCLLPFQHTFGNSVWQSHLLAGAHLVLDGQTAFPETLVEALVRHDCTSLSGVPDLFRMLLERSSLGQTPVPALRYMSVAGGALPHDLVLEMARRITPAQFFVMYGQTEATARLAYLPPAMLGQLSGPSIGQAVPGVTLEIVDEHGQLAAPGTTGELRARGENIMLGYWRDAQGTAERIRDGWLYTGDLAARDAAGWITIQGRSNAIVKIAGFRVQPADIDEFAVRRLGARQAVTVPFEAAGLGTRLALYLRLDSRTDQLSVSEMIARCRAELPRHMVPELIQVLDDFPLNAAMKIDRPLLARQAEETHLTSRRALA